MSSVTVEVEIDEFGTYDIVRELRRRVNKNSVSKQDKAEIEDLFLQLGSKPNPVKTLDDKIKMEFFLSVFDKYTSFELENLLTK